MIETIVLNNINAIIIILFVIGAFLIFFGNKYLNITLFIIGFMTGFLVSLVKFIIYFKLIFIDIIFELWD